MTKKVQEDTPIDDEIQEEITKLDLKVRIPFTVVKKKTLKHRDRSCRSE